MPPPNTPEEGLVATTTLALRPFVRGEPASSAVDLRALEYEGIVDENLICPICRVAFVAPIITACDHVFCHKCIVQAHALNPVCPVDRLPLKLASETQTAPKIVHNQLDNLMVRCPNKSRGCSLVVARSLVDNHVIRYCDKTLIPCPHPSCEQSVARKDSGKGCLHYDAKCEYCEQVHQKADLKDHQDSQCRNRKKNCGLCKVEVVRHKQDEHMKECPEAETPCRFAPFGCTRQMSRKHLEVHARACEYRVVGPMGEQLAELRAELGVLQEKDRLKDRRIKFLENKGFPMPSTSSTDTMGDMSLSETPANTENAPYESRDQYFLSLFETMESKVERLSSALNEVEGRHSMMLFNETLPIKDQLTEIRSTMGVLGMHVRWLMNFRLQERGRVGTGSPNVPGSLTQENSNGSSLPRRLSDTLRENPPRL
ncbi:Uu.00g073880.m01.CDS01 [Anthostomella pinea]|uniref:Uu.00g073880.m01.CDS01 n=1 Tax=Anthostomella pinea TaxID=933095 RepID=A0AAI8YNZ0_9PEZI|nr:Uu.00g073880.m01.CDS01 [Anthostomella pinea]